MLNPNGRVQPCATARADRATTGNGRVDGRAGPEHSGPEQPTDGVRVSMPEEE